MGVLYPPFILILSAVFLTGIQNAVVFIDKLGGGYVPGALGDALQPAARYVRGLLRVCFPDLLKPKFRFNLTHILLFAGVICLVSIAVSVAQQAQASSKKKKKNKTTKTNKTAMISRLPFVSVYYLDQTVLLYYTYMQCTCPLDCHYSISTKSMN